jgi:hypothetical protein
LSCGWKKKTQIRGCCWAYAPDPVALQAEIDDL